MALNITFTPAAEKFLRRIARFSGLGADAGVRLIVSPGGCSGYNSEFTAQAAPVAGEQVHEVNGLRVFLAAESRLMLDGVTVDFTETPTQSGLSFINPNQAACGCSSAETAAPAAVAHIEIGSIGRVRPAPVVAH